MIKADGSVLVHSDAGGYKPLMWMTPPCSLLVQDEIWTVTNKGGEELVISVFEVLSDVGHELGTDPGLIKDGVEKQLQALLADQCHVLGDGFTLVQREYFTDIGPVDLLCKDGAGAHVLVEIKRIAEIDSVEQLDALPAARRDGARGRAGRARRAVVQAAGEGAGGRPRDHVRPGRLRGPQGHGVERPHPVLSRGPGCWATSGARERVTRSAFVSVGRPLRGTDRAASLVRDVS